MSASISAWPVARDEGGDALGHLRADSRGACPAVEELGSHYTALRIGA
jgi:hypothetical protein